jgi:hypothetical protein
MGRIFITHLEARQKSPGGLAPIVEGDDRPIHLWAHHLSAGQALDLPASPADRALYLWSGSVVPQGHAPLRDGAIIVERGAVQCVQAEEAGALILEFQPSAPGARKTAGGGGAVHVLDRAWTPSYEAQGASLSRHWMFADATCPTCELWLSESRFESGGGAARHFHTEDEVMVIIGGEMRLGDRRLRRGGVVAIDRGAAYSFGVGDEGLAFVNFRPGPSDFVLFQRGGKREARTGDVSARLSVAPHVAALLRARGPDGSPA